MLHHDENQLLPKFRSGDKAAFQQVFMFYYKSLRLNAFLLLKDEQEAEDLVQQLFFDIWNQRLYANVHRSLKSYLHTSVKHRSLNLLKSKSRQTKKLHEYAGQLELDTSEVAEQPSRAVLGVLDGLPAQQFKAFNLIHMEDKRYQDAAAEMGISINSLKSHLKLAVKYLRIKLRASPVHPYTK